MDCKTLLFATLAASALCGCDSGPDPALVSENQQLKQQQVAQASELQQVKAENDALKTQQAQILKDMAEIKAAVSAPPPAPSVAAPAPDDVPPAASVSGPAVVQPASQSAASALKPSGADESKALEPGWIIETYPMKRDDYKNDRDWQKRSNYGLPEDFSLGSFIGAPSPINLHAHRKYIRGDNHVQYRASGYFTVQNRGDHVFVLTLADKNQSDNKNTTTICNLRLALEGQELVSDYVRIAPGGEFSINGGANLIEGLYQSQLAITCRYVYDSWNPDLSRLGTVSVSIAVRRPGAPAPVELGERDIVYISQR